MLGTSSCRVPSGLGRSMARPRLTCAGVIRVGLPSTTSNPTFISGIVVERLDQRVADEVGEGDLAAAGAGEVVVDHDAVVPEQLDRHRAHARGGRDAEAGVHVGHGAGGSALRARCRSARRSPRPRPSSPAPWASACRCSSPGSWWPVSDFWSDFWVTGWDSLFFGSALLGSDFGSGTSARPPASRRVGRLLGAPVDSLTAPLDAGLRAGAVGRGRHGGGGPAARWSLPKKSHHTLSTLSGSFW